MKDIEKYDFKNILLKKCITKTVTYKNNIFSIHFFNQKLVLELKLLLKSENFQTRISKKPGLKSLLKSALNPVYAGL